MYMFRLFPSQPAPMKVTAVIRFPGILLVAVIVYLGQLIPAVKHGDSRLHKHHGVQRQIELYRPLHCRLILLKPCFFDAAQTGCSAAEPGVAAGNVIIVKLPPAVAVTRKSLKIIVQIPFMENLIRAKILVKPIVIQPPSNIIVTAKIIQKHIILRQGVYGIELSAEQTGIPGRHGMPCGAHGGHIIKQMALGLSILPK
jgi:hypothetical protein